MDEDRLEALKKEQEAQAQFEAFEDALKQLMSRDALSRYGNIKAADQEKAIRLISILGQLVQKHGLTSIDDETLKEVLIRITPKKKFTIRK